MTQCEGTYKKSCSDDPVFANPSGGLSPYFTCSGSQCRYCDGNKAQCDCPEISGVSACAVQGGGLLLEDHCMDENQDGIHNIDDMLSCISDGSACGHPKESCGLIYSANPHIGLNINDYPDNCSKLLFEHAVGSQDEIDRLPPNPGATINLENPSGSVVQRILSYAAKKNDLSQKINDIIDLNDISSPAPFYKTSSDDPPEPHDSTYMEDLKDICLKFETVYNNGTCLTGADNNNIPFFTRIHEDCYNYLNYVWETEPPTEFTLNPSELSNWLNTFNYTCRISSPGAFNTMTNNDFSDSINNNYFKVNHIDGVNMIMGDNNQPIRPLNDTGACPDNTNYNIVCTNPNDMTFGAEAAVSNPCEYDQIDLQQQLSNLHSAMTSLSQQNTQNSQQNSLLYANLEGDIDSVNNNILGIEQRQDTYSGDFQQASAQFQSINDQMATLTAQISSNQGIANRAQMDAANALAKSVQTEADVTTAEADSASAVDTANRELGLTQTAQADAATSADAATAAQTAAETAEASASRELELARGAQTDAATSADAATAAQTAAETAEASASRELELMRRAEGEAEANRVSTEEEIKLLQGKIGALTDPNPETDNTPGVVAGVVLLLIILFGGAGVMLYLRESNKSISDIFSDIFL